MVRVSLLGISKIQKDGRFYVPVIVTKKLGLSQGDEISFVVSENYTEIRGAPCREGVTRTLGSGNRVKLPIHIVRNLSVGAGDDVLTQEIEEGGEKKIILARTVGETKWETEKGP